MGSASEDTSFKTSHGERTVSSIAERVKKIVMEQLSVEEDKIKPEASFINDLGADSLDIVELIMQFEEDFEMQIPDEDAEKIVTVGDAITYIEAKAG